MVVLGCVVALERISACLSINGSLMTSSRRYLSYCQQSTFPSVLSSPSSYRSRYTLRYSLLVQYLIILRQAFSIIMSTHRSRWAVDSHCYKLFMQGLTDSRPPPSSQHYSLPTPTQHTPQQTELELMKHFETINQPTYARQELPDQGQSFSQAFTALANPDSPIDAILEAPDHALSLSQNHELVEQPVLPQLKPSLLESLRRISFDFDPQPSLYNHPPAILDLDNYSSVLAGLGGRPKNVIEHGDELNLVQQQVRTQKPPSVRAASPPPSPKSKVPIEIQVEPAELESGFSTGAGNGRKRKAETLLMELMRVKKRPLRGTEYFAVMENKLMELLDYILQGEQGYAGLDPTARTKAVLRNLESFQGKMLEGESKINLLRVFFEQFTALKKEKDQQPQAPAPYFAAEDTPTRRSKPATTKPRKTAATSNRGPRVEQGKFSSGGGVRDEWMGSM